MMMILKYDYNIDHNVHYDNNNNSDNDNSITIIMIKIWLKPSYLPERKKRDREFEREEEEMAYLNACKEWFPYSFWGRPHVFRGCGKHCRDIAWYLLTKNEQE